MLYVVSITMAVTMIATTARAFVQGDFVDRTADYRFRCRHVGRVHGVCSLSRPYNHVQPANVSSSTIFMSITLVKHSSVCRNHGVSWNSLLSRLHSPISCCSCYLWLVHDLEKHVRAARRQPPHAASWSRPT